MKLRITLPKANAETLNVSMQKAQEGGNVLRVFMKVVLQANKKKEVLTLRMKAQKHRMVGLKHPYEMLQLR